MTPEDFDKVKTECQKKMSWLNDMIAKQNETPKHKDPVVTVETIMKEMDNLTYFVNPILNKPKPKQEKKKEEDSSSTKETPDAPPTSTATNPEDEQMIEVEGQKDENAAEMNVD